MAQESFIGPRCADADVALRGHHAAAEADRAGVLDTDMTRRALRQLLTTQYERWWNTNIQRFRSKKQFLGYAGRYARRPPIAQHRFRKD